MSTTSLSARSSSPRPCTRSSATGAAASRTRWRRGWCGSPTRSTWPMAARACLSSRVESASMRFRRQRSTRWRSRRATDRAVRVEIKMNNSAGIFQVDDLLATKLRGTPLEGHVEVVATIEGETEKRLLTEFRLPRAEQARAVLDARALRAAALAGGEARPRRGRRSRPTRGPARPRAPGRRRAAARRPRSRRGGRRASSAGGRRRAPRRSPAPARGAPPRHTTSFTSPHSSASARRAPGR